MNELLHQDSTQELATIIFEKVDRAFEDGQFIAVPQLTREVFQVIGTVQELMPTREWNAICEAVDFLIEEGSVAFNSEDGHITRV